MNSNLLDNNQQPKRTVTLASLKGDQKVDYPVNQSMLCYALKSNGLALFCSTLAMLWLTQG
jgi:hypothetical protein